jgi:hypothetical protein
LTISTRTAQERAEASFKKKEKQYEANALAVREKTARLRALRLAHETRQGAEFAARDSISARKEKRTAVIGLRLGTL